MPADAAPPAEHEAQAILQSLQAGVVPRAGLQHLAVGRAAEVRQALRELRAVQAGGGIFKVIIGDYGSGKTFFLRLVRQVALHQGCVVTEADLSPDLRLRGDGRGLATYRHLVAGLATDTRGEGGALSVLLDRWCDDVRQTAVGRLDSPPAGRTPALAAAVDRELRLRLRDLQTKPRGAHVAAVLRAYFEASLSEQPDRLEAALRWFRGEYRNATAAAAELRMPGLGIIRDEDWVEHLRLLGAVAAQAGFGGLLCMLDEGVNLYRISQPESRAANYEVLLGLCNDALQGRAPYLGVFLAGPPEMLADPRRGLYSYPALKSRLQINPYEDARHRDLAQPVLHLPPLGPEELLALLLRVRRIHAAFYGPCPVDDADAKRLLDTLLARPGADRFLTVREALRSFIHACNILQQHPDLDKEAVLAQAEAAVPLTPEEPGGGFVPLPMEP